MAINTNKEEGIVWVCTSCGKWSNTEFGLFDLDESCGLHAIRVEKNRCIFDKSGKRILRILN